MQRRIPVSLLEDRMHAPLHLGPLEDPSGIGAVGNPACGDVVTVYVSVRQDVVAAASFESMGSAYQLATASVLCDLVIGQSVADSGACRPGDILEALPDLPENKHHLAHLAVDALHRALASLGRSEPSAEAGGYMSRDDAQSFVLALLSNGRQWGTREIEAMARADGLRFATAPVAFLASLRRDGMIAGEMDVGARSWRWWLRGSR